MEEARQGRGRETRKKQMLMLLADFGTTLSLSAVSVYNSFHPFVVLGRNNSFLFCYVYGVVSIVYLTLVNCNSFKSFAVLAKKKKLVSESDVEVLVKFHYLWWWCGGGGFFLACEDFGRMFDHSFPARAFCCCC